MREAPAVTGTGVEVPEASLAVEVLLRPADAVVLRVVAGTPVPARVVAAVAVPLLTG